MASFLIPFGELWQSVWYSYVFFCTKVLTCRQYNTKRIRMDTERAGKILEAHGLTKKAFADMIGLKASTTLTAFSTKRFSKKMVAKLEELGTRE